MIKYRLTFTKERDGVIDKNFTTCAEYVLSDESAQNTKLYNENDIFILDQDIRCRQIEKLLKEELIMTYSGESFDTAVDITNQEAKKDAGKPRLTLVPRQIIYDICKVREFAVDHKYKDPDNWKKVDVQRYRDAAFRHFLLYLDDPKGVDEESGLPHYYHLVTNLAFICELEKEASEKTVDTTKWRKAYENA